MAFIVLMAPESDVHAIAVRSCLERLGVDVVIWDTGLDCRTERITATDDDLKIATPAGNLKCSEIRAVWLRRPRAVEIPPVVVDPQARRQILDSHNSLLSTFILSFDYSCINHLLASTKADEKPVQLATARACGLDVPSTIFSNDIDVITNFVATWPSRGVVIKPMANTYGCFAGARVVTLEDILSVPNRVKLCPAIYQELIEPADDLRITIVGEEVFVARVIKRNEVARTHIDWRRDPTNTCYEDRIPDDVRNKLLGMMRALNLKYGAIDVRRTPDGRHWFLEVNTAGQYLWVEADAGLEISGAIARLLLSVARF